MKTIDVKYKNTPSVDGNTPAEVIKKNTIQLTYFGFATTLCFIVLIATIAFFYYNNSLASSIKQTKTLITQENSIIQEAKTNPDIIAYDLVEKNKKQIDTTIVRSQAQNYISEVQSLADRYHIRFQGFSFSKDTITTSASIENNDVVNKQDPITLVSAFIKDFRTAPSSTGSIFTLSPIDGVSGDETKRSFSLEFKLR